MGFLGIKRCGEKADIDVVEKCAVKADFSRIILTSMCLGANMII
jgi:hypothetical protein